MNDSLTLAGKIVSGARRAAFFTQLDWVQAQCREKLGFTPYPGTLNLEISESAASQLDSLAEGDGPSLIPPDPNFCRARTIPVKIKDLQAAVIIPAENVQIHAKNIVEIIAPVCLKEVLGLKDGDLVQMTFNRR